MPFIVTLFYILIASIWRSKDPARTHMVLYVRRERNAANAFIFSALCVCWQQQLTRAMKTSVLAEWVSEWNLHFDIFCGRARRNNTAPHYIHKVAAPCRKIKKKRGARPWLLGADNGRRVWKGATMTEKIEGRSAPGI